MKTSPILRVAVAVPLRAFFDYLPVQDDQASIYQPGVRLRVPFGRSERTAVLIEVVDHSEISPTLLKPALEVLDDKPLLNQSDLEFLKWVAAYYHHPTGEVIFSSLPVRLRQGKAPAVARLDCWSLTEAGRVLEPESLARAPRQQALLQLFKTRQTPLTAADIAEQINPFRPALKGLIEKGLLIESSESSGQSGSTAQAKSIALNDAQKKVVDSVLAAKGFKATLLYGITGSGKTATYQAIASVLLKQNSQILVLVPEIGLTPQLLQRFYTQLATFADSGRNAKLVTFHSGMTEAERSLAWQQAACGEADIVVGTRSAVFMPMPNLGLIVVDEEHDQSFKQQEGFRYSARDLAVVRAKRSDCPVILGSATPSFESFHNARKGHYQLLQLTERAANAKPPKIELIDIRSVNLDSGFSPVTRRLIKEELGLNHQVMVFINRRGFAPVVTCHDCGWVAQCLRCDARMTAHMSIRKLHCHHCGAHQHWPEKCPECESIKLSTVGEGTEQVESALQTFFPDNPCVRIDRDSTRKKGSMDDKLNLIREGHGQILVGTQMLAKGHDFPNVTLVVMLDVDHGFYGTDFRAAERMSQLILQVAGRAGRAEKPGRVLIQTRHPDHPLLHVLIHQGYAAYAEQALAERQLAQLPPFGYQVLIRAEANKPSLPENFLLESKKLSEKINKANIEFWGPVAATMQRKKGQHRFQLLLQSAHRGQLHDFLEKWLPMLAEMPSSRRVRWSVDVDPQDFYS
jgi:primosomal protein N' (replication factor Y) (superfamily II helicase)